MTKTWVVLAAVSSVFLSAPSAWAVKDIQSGVDFARLTHPGNQIGFMHGRMGDPNLAYSNPAVIQKAKELMPGIWRGVDSAWSMNSESAMQTGAAPVYVLSDLWNANTPNPQTGCTNMFWNRPLPFQDIETWKSWVDEKIAQIAARQPTGPVWIDIWNEPDWPVYWPSRPNPKCYPDSIVDATGSRYLAVFAAAEKVIRQRLAGRARIIGASTATSTWDWTKKMLDYCSRAGCKLDAIAWHFAGGTQASVDLLPRYAGLLRKELSRNKAWIKASQGARTPLWMTEYLPVRYHLMPGSMVSYWYGQERAGVSMAALTDWRDQGSRLNSLLEEDGSPRTTWWAARAYALGRKSRVLSWTGSGYYSLLASRQGLGGKAQILVGNNLSVPRAQSIQLNNLGSIGIRGALNWSYRILGPAKRGEPVVNLPQTKMGGRVRVQKGKAMIRVRVPSGSIWMIDLNRA